ncbi:MAG: Type 1 glutamine amidotransferase-like domain-containing protein, partial [Bacilli bacterium]|nr:Type 1 glutamine amidotransferase-like domain-containing protein [Bacilli bacterium]
EGLSDSFILRGESTKYKMIKGLNYIDLSICPHFDKKKEKDLEEIIKKEKKDIYALEDNTALIINNKNIEYLKTNNKKIYHCYYKNESIKKEEE